MSSNNLGDQMLDIDNFTPQEIVDTLNKYIIGQEQAKRQVAIGLRNRWRSQRVIDELKGEIMPSNLLMIGPTGVGKTEIARRMAHMVQAPFVKVEASKFTEVGYVGRDVESMVRDLVEQSVRSTKMLFKKRHEKKAIVAAEEKVLNALLPPISDKSTSKRSSEQEVNKGTRENLRDQLRKGLLDDRKIEIEIRRTPEMPMGMLAGGTIDDTQLSQIQDMFNSIMPKKTKRKYVLIKDARRFLIEEEIHRRIDMEEVKTLAISRAEKMGMIFIDEIDKIATPQKREGADVSGEGVQRDLLPIVEGSSVTTKYGVVNTDHILFIAAGAFHVAKPSDLIPELQGRFPIRIELEALKEEDFLRILTEPKNALIKQYKALFQSEGVVLNITKKALKKMAEIAYELNIELENIGARRLHTVIAHVLEDYLFDMPDSIPAGSKISVGERDVRKHLDELSDNKDLSQYML